MSWRDMLQHSAGAPIRRYDEGQPPEASLTTALDVEASGRMGEYTFQRCYRTRLVVESQWYANQAQYRQGLEIAERAVAELLYSDVRGQLQRLREAVFNCRREDAMRIIDRIDEVTKP